MKKTLNSVLLLALISTFTLAGTMMAVKASPKAELYMVYNLTGHARETIVDNEQIWQYRMIQIGNVTESNILLDQGIIGGQIDFSWLVAHNKQSDVACGSGTFEIASVGGVVLVTGRVMARVEGFSTTTPVVEVKYLGHGTVNIRGITEDIGFHIVITIEGYYW